jgi:L-aminopeptidase/D-esterase-like protein
MDKIHSFSDIPGIKVGHAQDFQALTGCTVILCEKGAVAGVDQRGGAPGTRETDLLRPMHLVQQVHAILLAGGSAFGLDAATGVVRYLEERKIGFDVQVARVPIVPAAIIFDLGIGSAATRPDAAMGYQACLNARKNLRQEGNYGAGTGATVGKIFGASGAMKSGIGEFCIEISKGLFVGAIAVVNAFGDIVDPKTGKIIAGVRPIKKGMLQIGPEGPFADTLNCMTSWIGKTALSFASKENTVIGVVATNARLSKEEINKVAQMAHDGLARVVKPAHTMLDGDTIFSLSTGRRRADINTIGAYAAECFAEACLRACRQAAPVLTLPSAQNYPEPSAQPSK